MLARDPVEAAEQAQSFLRERPLTAFYDEVMLEGLHLAQRDADRGLLDDERTLQIRDAVAEIIDDLSAHQDSDEIVQQEDALKLTQSPLGSTPQGRGSTQIEGLEKGMANRETRIVYTRRRNLLDEAVVFSDRPAPGTPGDWRSGRTC